MGWERLDSPLQKPAGQAGDPTGIFQTPFACLMSGEKCGYAAEVQDEDPRGSSWHHLAPQCEKWCDLLPVLPAARGAVRQLLQSTLRQNQLRSTYQKKEPG